MAGTREHSAAGHVPVRFRERLHSASSRNVRKGECKDEPQRKLAQDFCKTGLSDGGSGQHITNQSWLKNILKAVEKGSGPTPNPKGIGSLYSARHCGRRARQFGASSSITYRCTSDIA